MKVVVVGTRGIPGIPGGVETHCEELYPRLAAMGFDVTVMRRKAYVNDTNRVNEYKGVKLVDVFSPKKKSLEAILHTFLAVIKAKKLKPDVLHCHAVGPSLVIPFARLLGMKVVMTNHGPDYDRDKWGRLAKAVIRKGEKWGTRYSNRVIVISKVIADILSVNYGRTDADLIYNGVNIPVKSQNTDYIRSLGIGSDDKYILTIGRFVKEKGFHDLVTAFAKTRPEGWKLVIAGDSDHPDAYSESLKEEALKQGVILTGYIKGEKLNQVMTNASVFVLPSYHEGLPIALLEAMSYNLDVIVSDIPANRLDCLEEDDFFPAGNTDALALKLEQKCSRIPAPRVYDLSPYNWDHIATQTAELYKNLKNK